MAKNKKDDWVENDGEAEVTLADFVIQDKIEAFVRQYSPLDHWTEDCDTYNDSQLRTYFKAVVCPLGDPLALYIQELGYRGFKMRNDESGEPVLYCRPKFD